nr:uncharacterized protein C7orf31 isoform X1 [Misgurnus anguillicaudatus]
MTSSFLSERIPAIIKGHRHFSYGGAMLPESVTIEQNYDLTPTKKSNLRLNDQLLPKPTDIDMSKRMIKSVIPKEHPYQSHISRYAMFPSYESPDDHHTGVRAASTLPLNPLLPSSAPAVTVLHKTKGSPYRQEILNVPMATRGEGMVWPGQCGFQNPSKGETQVMNPKPLKKVYSNATRRNRNITLSERSANMLRNLEKAHWLTSYQLHYTGTGPTNPIKLDDFNEKTIAMLTGEMNPLTTQLMERSVPTFIPSRPLEGRKTRDYQYRHALESTYAPSQFPPARSCSPDLGLTPPHKFTPLGVEVRKQNITVHKSAQGKDHVPHNLVSDACKTEQVTESNQSYEDARSGPVSGSTPGHCEICKKGMCLCRTELHVRERHQTTKSQIEKENEYLSKNLRPRSFKEAGKKSLHNWSDLQPRCTLLELQDSFSKSEAHRRLHETTKGSKTDLRDNHHAGRKHTFCGFNSYYFHN